MILNTAYVVAAVVSVLYAASAVRVAARTPDALLEVMAARAFALAVATAVVACLAGRVLGEQTFSLVAAAIMGVPFGVTAAALHAIAGRVGTSERKRSSLQLGGVAIAAALPFAAGITGLS